MTYRIFCEPRQGVVAHTAASKLLAENELTREWVGMVSEEMWPAAAKGRFSKQFGLLAYGLGRLKQEGGACQDEAIPVSSDP